MRRDLKKVSPEEFAYSGDFLMEEGKSIKNAGRG
jgi:hypothetical protein